MKLNLTYGTKRFLKYGAPMLLLMLTGSLGLSEFTDIRIKKREEKSRQLTAEESEIFNKKKNSQSLESLYDSMSKEVNITEWEQVRGPRIWEEDTLKILPTYKQNDKDS